MLGNGTRVVGGVVLVSGGNLKVCTRGRELVLRPEEDGTTTVVASRPWPGAGTRVEVTVRRELAEAAGDEGDVLRFARRAMFVCGGRSYAGKSSPWWYGPGAFWELL